MTEPRTESGRKLRDYFRDSFVHESDDTEPLDVSDRILAIEREAAELCSCDSYPDVCPFHSPFHPSGVPRQT